MTNDTNQHQPPPPPPPPPQQNVIADFLEGNQQLQLREVESNLRKTRNTIFVIAGLLVLGGILTMAIADEFIIEVLLVYVVLALVFVGLGFLTKKQPLTAIIIALVLYLALWGLTIAFEGVQYAYKGIIVRIVIVVFLIRGIKYAVEAERIKKEMRK